MLYFDTCYLARCYLEDVGFESVRRLAEQQPVACCELGRLELLAVFHRKLREGAISTTAFEGLQAQFDDDDRQGLWTWLPLDSTVWQQAMDAFRRSSPRLRLRSADAIHLSCARLCAYEAIYSNDRHLLAAADRFGLQGIDVIKDRP